MASVNVVHLLGNVGRDPDVRVFNDGNSIANVTIATSRKWRDKDTGDQKEETEWSRVVFYGKMADVVGKYVNKGNPLYVRGRLRTRKYEKDGQDHYATEIVAEDMQLLGGRPDGERREQTREEPRQQQRQQPRQAASFDDMDSDIPF